MRDRHDFDDKSLTPMKRIRIFCLECMGGSPGLVRDCHDAACHFHSYRLGRLELPECPENVESCEASEDGAEAQCAPAAAPVRLLRIIRRHCMGCVHNDRKAVRECTAKGACVLWLCRFGVRPRTVEKMRARRRRPKELVLPGLEGLTTRRK